MHLLKGSAAVAMLLMSVKAAPLAATVTPNAQSPAALFKPSAANSVNDCGDSSFTNETSNASPSVNDCLQIASNIGGGGTWEVENIAQQQHQLVQYGSCALGVQGSGSGQGDWFHVGNQDIIDLIHSSIDMYQWNGKVGSKGNMPCQGAGGNVNVNWGLYHT
jgi:Pathogen effector